MSAPKCSGDPKHGWHILINNCTSMLLFKLSNTQGNDSSELTMNSLAELPFLSTKLLSREMWNFCKIMLQGLESKNVSESCCLLSRPSTLRTVCAWLFQISYVLPRRSSPIKFYPSLYLCKINIKIEELNKINEKGEKNLHCFWLFWLAWFLP